MDKFQAMSAFVAIVDAGSLTAGAVAAGKSLPTMVRILQALEQELGVRLLNRTTRRIALTAEGSHYLARCRQILADVRDAEDLVAADRAVPRGTIRLTAPVQFGSLHVAPAVTTFLQQFPDITLDLVLLDRSVDLIEEGLDLAVRIADLPDSSLIAIPVGQMRRVCCASPALLERNGIPQHPRELAGQPCVRFGAGGPHTRWRFDDNGAPREIAVAGQLVCNHAATAVEACAAGLGFGVFLHYQIRQPLADGRLVAILEDYELPALSVSIVYPHTRFVARRTRLLVDSLRVRLAGDLADIATAG